MRHRATGLILGGLLVAAACRRENIIHPAPVQRTLETALVERQISPSTIDVDGVVVGTLEAVLSSRLAATVVEVSAVPGQRVPAGAILVRLDPRETDAALAAERAELEAARSSLELAIVNRARFERLASRGAATAIELERTRQENASAAATVASAEAALRRAEIDRGQSRLAAPFDAIVVEKLVSPGDLAMPGRPLVRLASRTGRRVEAAPGEEDAARLSVGQLIPVVMAGRVVESRVAEISGRVDPATHRRIVRLDLPSGLEPAVGSFARVSLSGPTGARLFVSSRAVVARGGLEIAWVVGKEGLVLRYVRTTASDSGNQVEVRSGLEAGDRVILDPPTDLAAGMRLRS